MHTHRGQISKSFSKKIGATLLYSSAGKRYVIRSERRMKCGKRKRNIDVRENSGISLILTRESSYQ